MNREMMIENNKFDLHSLNKFASVMAQGNGYLGLRAAHEEDYAGQTRGLYVAGIYNKATANESSDLVNLPDVLAMKIEMDGEIFSLLTGEVLGFEQRLNLETGELVREILWKNKAGARFQLVFQRFAAKHHLHIIASKVTITSLDKNASLKIVSGISAQQTNFGRQHLIEESVRVYNEKVMQGVYKTTESGHLITLAAQNILPEGSVISFSSKNRELMSSIKKEIKINEPFVLEKIGSIYTSLDQVLEGDDPEHSARNALDESVQYGYQVLLNKTAGKWKQFWNQKRVKISSAHEFDQTAMDFALYHVEIMTPAHDERLSVGAKGLTGEGYKGHVFWDTEMFILPFHLFTEPETARKLLRYRYLHLQQAKEKAEQTGYAGALFPWESAFSGYEETPEYAAINIKTGKRQKVASAIAEHHIVADIAYAAVQYFQNTNDEVFMKKEGLALLKDTARFWISRAVEDHGMLSLKDVIGPDEYTEHIDNNAYTNYLAYYNVKQALYYMDWFGEYDEWLSVRGKDFLERLYLPKPNKNLVIPQDDTFLGKQEIDLSIYKENQGSQGILLDYSRQEVNEMQILKQADVVMLLYLFPNLFSKDIVEKNLHYYEERTIHDSSLSKAIHAIVAARCGFLETAYRFFQEACLIDLGPNPHSSDEGIHGASLGAIWLAAIFGFANAQMDEDMLSIDPKLPENWSEIVFPLVYKGSRLEIRLTHEQAEIIKLSGPEVEMKIKNKKHRLKNKIEVKFKDCFSECEVQE